MGQAQKCFGVQVIVEEAPKPEGAPKPRRRRRPRKAGGNHLEQAGGDGRRQGPQEGPRQKEELGMEAQWKGSLLNKLRGQRSSRSSSSEPTAAGQAEDQRVGTENGALRMAFQLDQPPGCSGTQLVDINSSLAP